MLRRALLAAVAALLLVPALAGATADVQRVRIAGADRYETAANIYRAAWGAGVDVVLASGLNFPDALSAPSLQEPILLTTPDQLSPATKQALTDLPPTSVTIVGGERAVGAAIVDELAAMGITDVRRIAGGDRYETSRLIAEALPGVGELNGRRTAIVATGTDFADALAAGPLAFQNRFPILLTSPGALHPDADRAVTELGIQLVLLAGGVQAVSPTVEQQLKDKGIAVVRVSGNDRAETAANGASLVATQQRLRTVYLVTGRTFPDALAVASLAGQVDRFGPVLIADGWPAPSSRYVRDHAPDIDGVTAVGGPGAVPDDVRTAACRDAGGTAC